LERADQLFREALTQLLVAQLAIQSTRRQRLVEEGRVDPMLDVDAEIEAERRRAARALLPIRGSIVALSKEIKAAAPACDHELIKSDATAWEEATELLPLAGGVESYQEHDQRRYHVRNCRMCQGTLYRPAAVAPESR
jgi:hypothetical protein